MPEIPIFFLEGASASFIKITGFPVHYVQTANFVNKSSTGFT